MGEEGFESHKAGGGSSEQCLRDMTKKIVRHRKKVAERRTEFKFVFRVDSKRKIIVSSTGNESRSLTFGTPCTRICARRHNKCMII